MVKDLAPLQRRLTDIQIALDALRDAVVVFGQELALMSGQKRA